MLDCAATDKDDPTAPTPVFGRVGKQTVKDTGTLTKKRMETVDDEITERALGFIARSHKSGKPFFMWFNTTACTSELTAPRNMPVGRVRDSTTMPWPLMMITSGNC